MGAWHATYANLLRSRFSALVAYADLLLEDPAAAREFAQDSTVAVFSRRRSPRGTGAAERACRAWMAEQAGDRGASAQRVAEIRAAIDGDGEAGDPAEAHGLRTRFVQSASAYAVPAGGVNTLMEPAARRHRAAVMRAAGGTAAGVVAVGAAGWAALNYLPAVGVASADGTTASASPSSTLVAVTWNPEPEYDKAVAGFHWPLCGEEFAPAAQAVDGITAVPALGTLSEGGGGFLDIQENFTAEDGEPRWLLAQQGSYVVTEDDIVVYSAGDGYQGVDYYTTGLINGQRSYGIWAANSCEAREELTALQDEYFGDGSNSLPADEEEEYEEALNEIFTKYEQFTPGTYKIYLVTPVILGEQAALAEAFSDAGISSVNGIESDITWSDLSDDDRVGPYCVGSRNAGDLQCNIPPDVLRDVLTMEVDPANIDAADGGVAISAPIELTVPEEDSAG